MEILTQFSFEITNGIETLLLIWIIFKKALHMYKLFIRTTSKYNEYIELELEESNWALGSHTLFSSG